MTIEGKAGREIRPEFLDSWHVVGKGDNPLWIGKKRDLQALFTPTFQYAFEVWKYQHYGYGLPGGKPWDEQDPILMRILFAFTTHYDVNFNYSQG